VFDAHVLVTDDKVYVKCNDSCFLVSGIVNCAGRLYCSMAELSGIADRFPTITESAYDTCEPPAGTWRSVKFTASVRDQRFSKDGDVLKCGVRFRIVSEDGAFEALKGYVACIRAVSAFARERGGSAAKPDSQEKVVEEFSRRKAAIKADVLASFRRGDVLMTLAYKYDSDLDSAEKDFVKLMNTSGWQMDDDDLQRDVYDGTDDDRVRWSRLAQLGKVDPDLARAALDELEDDYQSLGLRALAVSVGIDIGENGVPSACRKLLRVLHEDELARKPNGRAAAIPAQERAVMRAKVEAASALHFLMSDLRDYA
jgi:hypothetical protein